MKSLSRSALLGSEMLQLCVISLSTYDTVFMKWVFLNSRAGFYRSNSCWVTKAPSRNLSLKDPGAGE